MIITLEILIQSTKKCSLDMNTQVGEERWYPAHLLFSNSFDVDNGMYGML